MIQPSLEALRSSRRIIFVLVGCVLVTVGLILGIGSQWLGRAPVAPPPVVFDAGLAHQTWRDAVLALIPTVTPASSDREVQNVLDKILALRVTAADQDMHLQLALALSARQRKEAGADQKLAALIQRIMQQP